MCGIAGVATQAGHAVSITEADGARIRDTLAHRGPDDDGLADLGNAMLLHRRLAVIDPTPAGHQPIFSPDRRYAMVYNGELYNDEDLREALSGEGVEFRTACDTETVLHAVARWGVGAASRLRGMYALAVLDTLEQKLVLARDPLGIKPLYTHIARRGGRAELTFASEPPAILAHPGISFEPDWPAVSAYLTTIRTVTGRRTMFRGIESLRPGEWRTYDLRDPELAHVMHDAGTEMAWPDVDADRPLADSVDESIRLHLRSDVPMCALLSGGLDSSIIAARTVGRVSELHTYCSGATQDDPSEDFRFAREVARTLGTIHVDAVVSRELFRDRWPDMVRRQGVPLSTPNEVAINEVCRTLRGEGYVVTLSGEGADELFGGYGPPLMTAHKHVSRLGGRPDRDGGSMQARSQQWVPFETKQLVLAPSVGGQIEDDRLLLDQYRSDFDAVAAAGPGDSPLQAHLRFQRRTNLANLLQRLDSASMLESVEGRTPLADLPIAAIAEGLPLTSKFEPGDPPRTKICLREAFADDLPAEVVARPKASFPLPFIQWMGDHVDTLARPVASEVFSQFAIASVVRSPVREWPIAWPMVNVTRWLERWWGR